MTLGELRAFEKTLKPDGVQSVQLSDGTCLARGRGGGGGGGWD